MDHVTLRRLAAIALFAAPAASAASGDVIEEIVVTADYRQRSLARLPASATVLPADAIQSLAVQHFEELIAVVPNLNWSGDGNRARYLQIRGVGELEQYEGAPNPSVGFLIDDIDFSGIGTVGTLFDIERVEVLRGPQGSRYGANALAGLVYLQSTQPTVETNGRVMLSAGNDDLRSAGLAFGGAVMDNEQVLFRVSAQQFASNGFRDNPWLGRDDTNGRDETTVRARLAFEAGAGFDADLAFLWADIDDGYDAFALDNSYTVLSDRPGRDAQQSLGGSARLAWTTAADLRLTSLTSWADSDIHFGFDADWGNPDSWSPVLYDYVSESARKRRTLSQELRIESEFANGGGWLAGLYALALDESLDNRNAGEYYDPFYDFADALDDQLASDYDATSLAAFGQLERPLGAANRLTFGLRVERRRSTYADSAGLATSVAETMLGGELAISHDFSAQVSGYLSLSRGYKAGGFNLGQVPQGRREFAPETLWNLEGGLHLLWPKQNLVLDLAVFRNRREDQQVRTSFQIDPGDPSSFVFYTDNAARGTTSGLEAELGWRPGEVWELYVTLGLLDAGFDEFITPEVDLGGRDQAHAPGYTFAAGTAWRHPTGWFARLDVSGKDRFYFDVSHDERSRAYTLANAQAGFSGDAWTLRLWGRNLFDRRYSVRGFYFGNEPPDFPPTLYTRAGDPRQFGLTIERRF